MGVEGYGEVFRGCRGVQKDVERHKEAQGVHEGAQRSVEGCRGGAEWGQRGHGGVQRHM